MLSRALTLATVMLLIGGFAADLAQAQNLEAGKSPSQIFAGTCNACHKSPRGLLKTVAPGSLPGFLRQHYTTSSEMAGLLSGFLISNGATDTRVGSQGKPGNDGKPSGLTEQLDRFGRKLRPGEAARPEPQQAIRPDSDGEPGRQGRNGKRLARPGETPEGERAPDGRTPAGGLKLGKRGKPGSEEPPKADVVKDTAKGEPSATEPVKDNKSETAKSDTDNTEAAKSEAAKSEAAKTEASKTPGSGEPPVLRADPVPAVTPASPPTEGETRPVQVATPSPSSSPGMPAVAPAAMPEPAAPPPAVTASAPPPVPPAGPPAPPISQ